MAIMEDQLEGCVRLMARNAIDYLKSHPEGTTCPVIIYKRQDITIEDDRIYLPYIGWEIFPGVQKYNIAWVFLKKEQDRFQISLELGAVMQ